MFYGQLCIDKRRCPQLYSFEKNCQKDEVMMLLGKILRLEGLATAKDILDALDSQKTSQGMLLGEILVEKGIITKEELEDILEKQKE